MSVPPDLTQQFGEVALRRAGHIAVESADGTFDYAALDRLSNQVAWRLRALGVGPGSRVGISWPRGAIELVAMLAIAKAGAAYVPMVTNHPRERLRMIVEDAAPDVMLVHPSSPLAGIDLGPDVRVLEEFVAGSADRPTVALQIAHDPEDLAYIMFTSGSTGRPKGVEITRGAFVNFLRSMAHTPGLGPADRLLAITTTGFDISGLELFGPLWVGATVTIADTDTARDPRLLRRCLEAGRFTVMQATPAMWRLLLDAGWLGDGALRMLCGGEALPSALADRLLANGGELWNLYGPTETTVWSSVTRIERGYDCITIGRAIDATNLYILDELGRPWAEAVGELGIGGDGVARGYRSQPELTARRFVTHGEGPAKDRIYRTGDLARRLGDGRFEWLGRLDQQVKISGNRIEIGEIEAILRAVPGVIEARVFADFSAEHEPRLVAYWIGDATRDALVEAARRALPSYMVPSGFVSIDAFPLNANGKVDAKQLPRAMAIEPDAPERRLTDVEACIAAAWRDVLGTGDVPLDADFFTLGGTSVLATAVILRIEQQLGTEVSMRCFFESRTVARLAAALDTDAARSGPVVLSLRSGRSDRPPLFCLYGLDVYQRLALALGDDREVIGAHAPFRYVPGRDARPEIAEIASHYLPLLRTRQPRGPYHLLGLCFGGVVAYEVARLLEAEGERVATVTVIDARLPNAVRVDRAKRLRHAFDNIPRPWHAPQEIPGWVRRESQKLIDRVPMFRRLKERMAAAATAHAIDLPLDGVEVDRQLREFSESASRIAARLLIVRATADRPPPWMVVDRDLGWGQRAADVAVLDIDSDHLGALREPHVRTLARVINDAARE